VSTVVADAPDAATAPRIPGEPGIWVLIVGDLLVFGAFFATFTYQRAEQPAVFDAGRRSLTVGFAIANTILLLTSSLFVATAVRAVRDGTRRLAVPLLRSALACGLGFVALKGIEWGLRIADGANPGHDRFYLFFFMLTGIHLLHVLIGLGALTVLHHIARRETPRKNDILITEVGASFWHLVDLLWIVLFPLLYLVR
jgi:nitric oxide reductase NorE protein